MTLIQEKIDELKYECAKRFQVTVYDIESGSRLKPVGDARKCFALLAREFYPEVKSSVFCKSLKKERSSYRKLLWYGRILDQSHMGFRHTVDSIRKKIKKPSCSYCKNIIK